MRDGGLSAEMLHNPETLIPGGAVRELLEGTARTNRRRRLRAAPGGTANADRPGPVGLVLKMQSTAPQALDTVCRDLVVALLPSGHCSAADRASTAPGPAHATPAPGGAGHELF